MVGAPVSDPVLGTSPALWVYAFTMRPAEAGSLELREILEDEPEWVNILRIVPIQLDGRNPSAT